MARDREKERKASEAAHRRLQVVLERTPFAIAVYEGPDLVLQLANPALLHLFDKREEDVIGKPFARAFPELDRRGHAKPLRRVYETGEPSDERLENVPHDRHGGGRDEGLILDVARVPLRDANGDVEGVLVQIVDVTDQVLSQRYAEGITEKAREKGSRLEAILQGIVDAVLAVDAGGSVLFRNEVFRRQFGDGAVGAEEAGTRLGTFVPLTEGGEPMSPEEMPQVRASHGETFDTRFAIRREDGSLRLFEARGHPLPGDEGEDGGGVIVTRGLPED